MLVFIITVLSCHIIYSYLFNSSSSQNIAAIFQNNCIYYAFSSILSIVFLKAFMVFGRYTDMTVLLWCIYIPFSVNLMYLIWKTLFIQGEKFSKIKLWLKSFICVIFFLICFKAYSDGYICALPKDTPLGHLTFSFVVFFIIISSFIWLYGEKIFCHLKVLAYQIYAVLLVLTPFLLFFILEISSNPNIRNISLFNALLNILVMVFFEVAFFNIFKNRVYGLYILIFFAVITGIANHFVVEFRNNPIMAIDILAIRTALSVSDQYHYQFTDGIVTALLIAFLVIALLSAFDRLSITVKKESRKEKLTRRFISGFVLVIGVMWIGTTDFEKSYAINVDYWWPATTYNNSGFATAFITFLQKLKIDAPEGYSKQLVEDLLENTSEWATVESVSSKPTIITIMNESFSDLSVLGPLQCTRKDLKNFYALQEDPHTIEFGINYVSTRGGGTSTTEFEFLTGNSMSNIPGTNPYAQFDFRQIPSIVKNVKEQGYTAIAMHPENPNNWRRKDVYTSMGFDRFLSKEDFVGYETTVYDRISDLGNYKKLIDIYERQKKPSFIFNVTMQNHGGYDISAIDETKRVLIDEDYAYFTDVQAYESLIHEADEAIGYLIDYFRNTSDPVIICFFGDHQPALNSDFENQLVTAGRQYNDSDLSIQEKYFAVPYFIWSNYPVDSTLAWDNDTQQNLTSTNYLGSQLLYYAGLKLSNYSKFLLDQREQIPVINYVGYLDKDIRWHVFSEDSPYLQVLNNYRTIQYNAMFDKKKESRQYQIQGGS